MTYKEIIKYLETKYKFKIEESHDWTWSNWKITATIRAKSLDYVDFQKKSGYGDNVLMVKGSDNGAVQMSFLMPDPDEINEEDVLFLTTNRKTNLWVEYYNKNYSNWKDISGKNITEEKIDGLLLEQKNKYIILNNLHKESEMKNVLDTINKVKENIKTEQTTLKNLKKKLVSVSRRKLSIED